MIAERCDDCGRGFPELEHDHSGHLLCLTCFSRRNPVEDVDPEEGIEPFDPVRPEISEQRAARSSWDPVDLEPILTGEHRDQGPELLAREDGACLLYRERIHAVYAEPEAGKGWLALHAAAEQLVAPVTVVYIDYEDTASNIVDRLRLLGVSDSTIRERFHYVRPEEPINDPGSLIALNPALVVIDGNTEALAVEGLDMANNQDVAEFYKRLARPFARAGAAVLLIDHVVKDREARGRYAIGAQHKLAGVDVAYRLDVAQPFGRGRAGLVKVTVTKDRPGFVRQHAADRERIALMRLTSHPDGAVTVTLEPPEETGTTFRPTVLMGRVSGAVADNPGLSKRAIREAVGGQHKAKDLALELLISEGYIEPRRDGQAMRHYSLRPFTSDDDNEDRAQRAQPCPDRAEARVPTVPPCLYTGTGHAGHTNDLDRAQRLLEDNADLNGGPT